MNFFINFTDYIIFLHSNSFSTLESCITFIFLSFEAHLGNSCLSGNNSYHFRNKLYYMGTTHIISGTTYSVTRTTHIIILLFYETHDHFHLYFITCELFITLKLIFWLLIMFYCITPWKGLASFEIIVYVSIFSKEIMMEYKFSSL